jgi:hypothetical protein
VRACVCVPVSACLYIDKEEYVRVLYMHQCVLYSSSIVHYSQHS